MKNLLGHFFTASVLVVLGCGCSQEKLGPDPEPFPGQDSIQVILQGADAIEFTSKAQDEQFQLNVYSVSEWHAQTDADWLLLTKSEDALIVGAERNRSLDARTAVVTVTDGLSSAEFEVSQQAGKVAIYHVEGMIAQGAPARAVSSNGRYVLGFSSAGTWVVDLWSLGDLESGGNIPEENVMFYPNSILGQAYSVSNQGVPVANGITADGSMEVTYETVVGFSTAYIIRNGVKEVLPAPAATEPVVGTLVPNGGNMAWWISDDGRYIAGRHSIPRGQVVECGWTYNDATGQYDFAICGEDQIVLDEEEWAVQGYWVECMSQNGKYVGGRTYGVTDESQQFPYFHDTETGEFTILESFSGESISMVTNDGWAAIAGTLGNTRFVDLNGDRTSAISMNEWLQQQFRLTDEQLEELGSTAAFGGLMRARCVNSDMTTACFAYYPAGDFQALQCSDIITIE